MFLSISVCFFSHILKHVPVLWQYSWTKLNIFFANVSAPPPPHPCVCLLLSLSLLGMLVDNACTQHTPNKVRSDININTSQPLSTSVILVRVYLSAGPGGVKGIYLNFQQLVFGWRIVTVNIKTVKVKL